MTLGVHHVIGVTFILATDNLTAQRGGWDPSAGESMVETSAAWDGPFQISLVFVWLPRLETPAQLIPCSASPPGVQLGIMFWVSVSIRILIYGSLDSHRICATCFSRSLSLNPLNRVRQADYNPYCSDYAPIGHLPSTRGAGNGEKGMRWGLPVWASEPVRHRPGCSFLLQMLLWFPINLATLTGAN